MVVMGGGRWMAAGENNKIKNLDLEGGKREIIAYETGLKALKLHLFLEL